MDSIANLLNRVLLPDAEVGRRYPDVPWNGRIWTVVHERVTVPDFLDIDQAVALAGAIGTLTDGTILVFRCTAWDLEPNGRPNSYDDSSTAWKEYWQPGGVMDAGNPLTLYMSCLETGSIIEFRATGPEANDALDRLHTGLTASRHPSVEL